jgi:hypothetical protein
MEKIKTTETNVKSSKRLAKIAGLLYLGVGVFGGFAEGFVDPKMYAAGNAEATTANLVAHSGLVRFGTVAHFLDGVLFIFTALALYMLLKHVSRSVARAMLILVAVAAGISCLNAVFQFEALRVATGAVNLSSLGQAGSSAISLLLLDVQHYGTLAAQVFFGLWLIPLGYLTIKSGWFPKALGVVLIIGGICYIVDLLAAFLIADFSKQTASIITIPSAIAEIWMVGYLLIVGVRTKKLAS